MTHSLLTFSTVVTAAHLAVATMPATAVGQNSPRGRVPVGSLATSTIMWTLDSACTAGALAACDTLGMHHWSGGDKAEQRVAVGIWQSACAAGAMGACANLALAYNDGAGVKRDNRRALALSRQACDSGSAPGCVTVAVLLTNGHAGPKDLPSATTLMERACDMADLYGCLNMGYRALEGLFGVTVDSSRARTFFERTCTLKAPTHPYPWYRDAADEGCKMARRLTPR